MTIRRDAARREGRQPLSRGRRLGIFPDVQLYEHRLQPPISRARFLRRMARHGGYVGGLVVLSVLAGTIGYNWLGEQTWIDSFLNACMLLGGMGPIGELHANAGKIFAALFALYSGLVFLIAAAVLFTPVLHRVIHRFHWDADQGARR